jgi:uncharacterized protein (DUF2252 family)
VTKIEPRFPLPRETIEEPADERRRIGRDARSQTPPKSHAAWDPGTARPDPVATITGQDRHRIPELVPLRHYRMVASPFAFYRGTARIMAQDLARTPTAGLFTQICGDAHLSNFGAFGTPERRLIFDLNDFDETLLGPFEWDVKRLATSLYIVGRANGFSHKKARSIVRGAAGRYRTAMAGFGSMGSLDLWYASLPVESVLDVLPTKALRKRLQKNMTKALQADSATAQRKLTEVVRGRRQIITTPPVVYRLEDLMPPEEYGPFQEAAPEWFDSYVATLPQNRRHLLERHHYVDMALKVVGVGSVGTRCFIVYLEDGLGDPLFLQIKEAQKSVLEDVLPESVYDNDGQRVVLGQRLMQAASDVFLGWAEHATDGREYYFRQLKDWKYSSKVEKMDADTLTIYGAGCAWNLARAHARGGDPLVIAGYLGDKREFDDAIVEFSVAYADQNDADYARFKDACDSGEIPARSEKELAAALGPPGSH